MLFVVFCISEETSCNIFVREDQAREAFEQETVPHGDGDADGKYLLRVEAGTEFGASGGGFSPGGPDPDYPFYGAKVLMKELSEDE